MKIPAFKKLLVGMVSLVATGNVFGVTLPNLVSYDFLTNYATISNLGGIKMFNSTEATNAGFFAYNLKNTNYFPNYSPIVIAGSTVSGVNGIYGLYSSNFSADLPRMIWTNSLNNGKIIYANDPGVNTDGYGIIIETGTNDASFLYIGAAIDGTSIPYTPWAAFTAPGSDVLTELITTNIVITGYTVLSPTNFNFTLINTNLVVDPLRGDDAFANRTNRVPFATIAAAYAVATNGDTVELMPYVYTEGTPITTPTNVTLLAEGATIANGFTFTDNCFVRGYPKFTSAPHFKMTNNIKASFEIAKATGASGDGIDVDSGAGLMQFYNMDNGSYWDACVLDKLSSNAVVEFYNCRMYSVYEAGHQGIVQGSHALTWYLDDTGGGKVRLYQGSLTVLNATNTIFTGPYGNNNSCLSIINKNSHTNIGNASLEIYGTVITHGTTNAGVEITAITNSLNVPIYGYYTESKIGDSLSSPSVTNTFNMLSLISVPSISITNAPTLGLSNAAPGGFSVGVTVPSRWFKVTNNGASFLIPGYIP